MLGHQIFDPEIGKRVLVDHVFIVAGGDITEQARNWLANALDASQRRSIIFMDQHRHPGPVRRDQSAPTHRRATTTGSPTGLAERATLLTPSVGPPDTRASTPDTHAETQNPAMLDSAVRGRVTPPARSGPGH